MRERAGEKRHSMHDTEKKMHVGLVQIMQLELLDHANEWINNNAKR